MGDNRGRSRKWCQLNDEFPCGRFRFIDYRSRRRSHRVLLRCHHSLRVVRCLVGLARCASLRSHSRRNVLLWRLLGHVGIRLICYELLHEQFFILHTRNTDMYKFSAVQASLLLPLVADCRVLSANSNEGWDVFFSPPFGRCEHRSLLLRR